MATYATLGGQIDAEGGLKFLGHLFQAGVGRGLAVTQNAGGASMLVNVSVGGAMVVTDTGTAYYGYTDSIETVSVETSDPASARQDLLVMWVDLSLISAAVLNNVGATKFTVVSGVAGEATDPDDADIQTAIGAGNPFIVLARVNVAAATTTIVDANLADMRQGMNLRVFEALHDRNGEKLIEASNVTTPVNWLRVKNSAAGSPLELEAVGNDTTIDIKLVPKGAGRVKGPAPAVDANGWTVYDYGEWKKYCYHFESNPGSVPAGGGLAAGAVTLPVGLANYTGHFLTFGFAVTNRELYVMIDSQDSAGSINLQLRNTSSGAIDPTFLDVWLELTEK